MKKTKGYQRGGKLKMVEDPDTGKKVPFFTVDGEGKANGGQVMIPKTKGYFRGGKVMDNPYGGLAYHTPRPFPGKRGVGAPPRAREGGKG
jgi:hypothetical protein